MRITSQMTVNNAIQHISESLEKMDKLSSQIDTGKQFQNASEDPVNASLSLSLKSNLRTINSFVDTAAVTGDWMNATDYAMQNLGDLATRANSLILRGLNETMSGKDRATTLGAEMKDLANQAIDLGNTQSNGQYIFAGFQVNTKPFVIENDNTVPVYNDYLGNTNIIPQKVTYFGDTGSMQRSLGPDQSVTLNIRGDQAIQQFIQNLVKASEAMTQNPYDRASLQTAMAGLQSSISVLDQNRTSNGTRMRQVETSAAYLEQVKIETKSLLSKKEDANVAEAIALLSNQKTTYQAVLEVSQRAISSVNLFDYLK